MKLIIKVTSCIILSFLTLSSLVFASDLRTNPKHTNKYGHYHKGRVGYKSYSYKGRVGYKAHSYKGRAVYKGDLQGLSPRGNHFEVIGAPGIAKLSAGNSYLQVTSQETDTLVQTNSSQWSSYSAQLGVGYLRYFCDPNRSYDRVHWFSSVEPEVNLYYLGSDSIDGVVNRFGNPNWGQLNYDMPVRSTRLMLDMALNIVAYKHLSFYGIAGIGHAWNRVAYHDSAADVDCPPQTLNLNYKTSSNFAWEAGPGLLYDYDDRFSFSGEYLFTYLGKVKPGSGGSYGTIANPTVSASSFTLRAQTILVGLHIALG